ncbi:MAG: hypothetical protein QME32_00235 [Endomicrobiia bacterium]|nr:hypothetical protein [Endomicrobiia bacterium]
MGENEINLIGGFIVGVIFGVLAGGAIGMLYTLRTVWDFLKGDPDGLNKGWRSRLEQLGQRHPEDKENK